MPLLREAPGGFQVVQIPVLAGLPFSQSVFLKQNHNELDKENEILLARLDSSMTVKALKQALDLQPDSTVDIRLGQTYGESKWEEHRKDGYRSCTRFAVLSFPTRDAKTIALQRLTTHHPQELGPIPLPMDCLECRVAEYQHRYHDVELLQRHVDAYMENYDSLVEKKLQQQQNVVDDEGFTLVTASSSGKRSPDGVAVQAFKPRNQPIGSKSNMFLKLSNLTGAEDGKAAKKKGGIESNFYRFQLRKQKEDEYLTLKRKQEQEVEIVEEMKRRKKFKPV